MEAAASNPTSKRIAVVTGGNKGIGLEICRQLLSAGEVLVLLTARDEERGLAAVEKLRAAGAGESDVVFHQLDVVDSASVVSLADFIRAQFGKLDILVNNAGVGTRYASIEQQVEGLRTPSHILVETYDLSENCIQTNYHGVRKVTEALIPLLQQSQSPRIVNLSSAYGKIQRIPGEHIREIVRDVDNLTEDRLDELVQSYLDDFKRGCLKENGWPTSGSAYIVSKVAVSAYTRLLARRYPKFCINCVGPGYVKTDMTRNQGIFTVEEGAKGPVMLALLRDGPSSGHFYDQTKVSAFE